MASIFSSSGIDTFDGLTGTTAANDVINVANGTANAGDQWNGGAGSDVISLISRSVSIDLSSAAISGVETLLSGKRNDRITISLEQFDSFDKIDAGRGKDTLSVTVAGKKDVTAASFASLTGVETLRLTGTNAVDAVKLTGSQLNAFHAVSLGEGRDTLNLTSLSTRLNSFADSALLGVNVISAGTVATGITINLSLQSEGFTLIGGAGVDLLTGSAGNDIIRGGLGADVLNGGFGSDTLDYTGLRAKVSVNLATGAASGGAAGDVFTSFENLTGGVLADVLTGDAGANVISGGGGKDMLAGGAGADRLVGGVGADTATYAASAAGVTVNLSTGTGSGGDAEGDTLLAIENLKGSANADNLTGGNGNNVITSGAGNDAIFGLGGNDKLNGGAGNDQIDGGDGRDLLTGGTGNDTLSGGAGNDKLTGSTGIDSLTGGADADLFVFKTTVTAGLGANADTITDFTSGLDRIDLGAMDANRKLAGNQAFSFIGGDGFTSHAGELRFDSATGILSGDVTGDGKADFNINLGIGTTVTGADFIL